MSLIRDDDDLAFVTAAVIAFAVGILLCAVLSADGQALTLKGRLSGGEYAHETGTFFLDADELGSITVNVGEVSYLADYLDGYRGRRVIVTIAPETVR